MNARRRPRFTSRLDRARNVTLEFLIRPFRWFRPITRFYIVYGLFVVATTLLLVNANSRTVTETYQEGEVVRRTIISPADISVMDWTETEKRRAAAKETARPVFTFDPTRAETATQTFRSAWEDLQRQAEAHNGGGGATGKKDLKWQGEGDRAVVSAILAHRFSPTELESLTRILREVADGYIYEDGDLAYLKEDISLVDKRN